MEIDYTNYKEPSLPTVYKQNYSSSDKTPPNDSWSTDKKNGYRIGYEDGYTTAQERHCEQNLKKGFYSDYSNNEQSYYKDGFDAGYEEGYKRGLLIGQNNGLVLGLAMQPLEVKITSKE